ncbi:hypothetical protein FOL47_006034, partial [Perkinsus chesapeaki]
DGTLLDLNKTYGPSVEELANGMQSRYGLARSELEGALGYNPVTNRFNEDALCMTATNSDIEKKLREVGIPSEPVMDHLRGYKPTFVTPCDLSVLFSNLRRLGVEKIGVLSLDDVSAVMHFLEEEGVSESDVDGVVGGDMNLRPKPSNDGSNFLLKKWKCENAEEAMMVGDHPMDMQVGAGFGWRVGVYGTGLSSPEELWAAGATHVIKDISELIDREQRTGFDIPEDSQYVAFGDSDTGDKYMAFLWDSGSDDGHRIICYYNRWAMEHIYIRPGRAQLPMDGTYKVCPRYWVQQYTILCMHPGGTFYPAFDALLSDHTKEGYMM